MAIGTAGDNCMDVYAAQDKAYPGGNAVNVAVYLRRLGAQASYTGAVGDDIYGEQMKRALEAKGVDISHLHTRPGKTAVTMVELVNGDRVFGDYEEGVMTDFRLSDDDISFLCGHDLVHTGLWGHIDPDLPALRECGALISFDFADQLDHPIVATSLPMVDYAFFSYTHDDDFIRDYLKTALGLGPRLALATLGENGSLAYDGKDFTPFGIIPVKVVDTMGAGDSYIAGFLQAILLGKSLPDCMRAGAESAALTLQYMGAWNA